MRKKQPPTKGAKGDAKRGVDTSMIVRTKDFDKPVVQLKKGGCKMKPGLVYLGSVSYTHLTLPTKLEV